MATRIKKKKRELKSKAIGLRGDVKLVACDLLRGVVVSCVTVCCDICCRYDLHYN